MGCWTGPSGDGHSQAMRYITQNRGVVQDRCVSRETPGYRFEPPPLLEATIVLKPGVW